MKHTYSLIAIIALCAVGCGTQAVNHIAGDGVYGKIGVPTGGGTSIGATLFVGRMDASDIVQPVSTNKEYAAPVAIAAAGGGKQGVTGNASTNSAAAITDGSSDASLVTTGDADASNQNGTNRVLKAGGN